MVWIKEGGGARTRVMGLLYKKKNLTDTGSGDFKKKLKYIYLHIALWLGSQSFVLQ